MARHKAGNFLNARYWSCCILFKVLVVAGMGLILWKAFSLQVLEHQIWLERERAQTETTLEVPMYRGSIYDRCGRLMAFSVPQPSLFADGARIGDPKRVALELSPILGEPSASIEKRLSRDRPFIWIKRHLTDRQAIAVNDLKQKGLHLLTEYKRFYPYGQVAGQVIGFTGLDGNGLEGVEKAYDRLLREDVTRAGQLRDGSRKSLWLESSLPPEPSENQGMRLTVDAFLQYVCESELEKAVEQYRAKSGEIVVIDARTLEVLAMANWPFFDPNQYKGNSSDAWRNRAITDSFEPGSTFKIFLMAAALEEGVVEGDGRIFCENGKCILAGHMVNDVHPYEWLTIPEVIKYSSNVGAAKIALQLGSERYYKYIRAFGFGRETGIGLPGEASGILRAWQKWRPIDLAVTGFGQSVGVTALQLTTAVAAIANNGMSGVPAILREAADFGGNSTYQPASGVFRQVVQRKTADQIRRMMQLVTEEGGTGIKAVPEGYTVAGKTGTAQMVDPETGRYASRKYTTVFTGFVPAENPRLVMTVVISEPQGAIYGGVVAAPVFRKIAAKALPYLGVPPCTNELNPIQGVRSVSTAVGTIPRAAMSNELEYDSSLMPDVVGLSLKAALQRLEVLGIEAKFRGSGKVVRQNPRVGTRLRSKMVAELTLDDGL